MHGNRENPMKQVHITCRCSMDGEVFITVRDEGDGFNSLAGPDPTDPQNQLLTHGRGVYLWTRFRSRRGAMSCGCENRSVSVPRPQYAQLESPVSASVPEGSSASCLVAQPLRLAPRPPSAPPRVRARSEHVPHPQARREDFLDFRKRVLLPCRT